MAYPNPYPRPAPDTFIRRWLFITACIAALMLLWQFLPAIEAWFSPREAERTVTARGDLAADEKATIELFENHAPRWSTSPPRSWCATSGRAMSSPCPVARIGFIWDDAGHVVTNFHVIQGASEATVKLADGRDYQAALVGRAQRTTSPYSRSVSASNARLPCRSAPAPTSRWDRRCLLSATLWPGLDAHHRHRLRARPLVTGRSGRPGH